MFSTILKMFSKQSTKQILQPQSYIQYTKRDPQTHKIQQHIQKYTQNINNQFKDWKRLKYKSYDVKKLLSNIQDGSFYDYQFQHNNNSISQEDSEIVFEWKRIPEIVKFCIYSSAQTFQNFQRLSLSNKKLKQALIFMHRTHPTKFKQLLAHDISPKGLYQFKLYNKGKIQNVIIDDYVPVVNKIHPLMTGPIADRQIFSMLLEKALAKVCGGYHKIPQNLDQLLEILFCGPLRKTKIDQLSNTLTVAHTVQKTLQNNGVAGFISRDNIKIRSFGINQNQLYHIVNKFRINIKKQQPIQLYELVSQKKLAAWNGKFSHNDNQWQKVPVHERTQLFKQLNKNKSFFISGNDIPRIFDHLIAFDGTDILNKQWIQLQSEVLYPSFSTFQLDKRNQVFIRTTTSQPLRTSMILAKDDGDNKYKYIKGVFHQSTQFVQITQQLLPGKYIICVHHDWILSRNGIYNIFVSTDTQTIVKLGKQSSYPNFLQFLFKNYSEESKKKKPVPDLLTFKPFYTIGMLAVQTGFAFIDFSLKQRNKKQVFIQIDPKALMNQAWQVIEPNTGRKVIHLQKGLNEQSMLILKTHKYIHQQNVHFPSTAFSVKA